MIAYVIAQIMIFYHHFGMGFNHKDSMVPMVPSAASPLWYPVVFQGVAARKAAQLYCNRLLTERQETDGSRAVQWSLG